MPGNVDNLNHLIFYFPSTYDLSIITASPFKGSDYQYQADGHSYPEEYRSLFVKIEVFVFFRFHDFKIYGI